MSTVNDMQDPAARAAKAKEHLARVTKAAEKAAGTQAALLDAIRQAHAAGASVRAVASAAGLTHPTVIAILADPTRTTVRRFLAAKR